MASPAQISTSFASTVWQQLGDDCRANLGEGLCWDAALQCLWMVDIHGRQLIRATDEAGSPPQRWPLDQRVGWVIPYRDGSALLLGLQEGFARVALPLPEPGTLLQTTWLHRPFGERTALRLNDAKADASGAIWAGSLNNDDESRADGCLFRLSTDGRFNVVDTGYTVANGPALRADGRLMLHTDSGRRTIYAFDLDVEAGTASGKRVWRRFTDDEGYPDGMCFDAEGCVWVAHWGAGCVSRFSADGELLRRIELPARHVTNVCFGGHALDRLFISTARAGLSEAELAAQPLAGALFEVRSPGTTGLPSLTFGG